MDKILIIQTAFIGDVILATAVVEKLYEYDSSLKIDMLVRRGNESLVQHHPKVNEVIIWDKQKAKYRSLIKVIKHIRNNRYDVVVNIQRFASTGLMTALSRAKVKVGFDKNPLSMFFTHQCKHEMNGIHEVARNIGLLSFLGLEGAHKPRLYPSELNKEAVRQYQKESYVCMAPSSVWFTKQWAVQKWIELINAHSSKKIYLLGAPDDFQYCESILNQTNHGRVENLSGKLSLLQSAALMSKAAMNYVNDSAPMHLASAVNAPVTAIFCSTIPKFGFGPLSDKARVVETSKLLDCRPCGLHGFKSCPKGHFDCALTIEVKDVLSADA